MSKSKLLSTFLALIFIFFWSSGAVFTKLGLLYTGPFTFLSLRVSTAAVLLLILCFSTSAPWPTKPRTYLHILIAGLLLQTIYSVGCFYALSLKASPALFAMILGAQPLLTALICYAVFKERLTWIQWFGLLLGFLGLLLVTSKSLSTHALSAEGLLFLIISLFGITFGTIYQKRHCCEVDPRTLCALQNAISAIPIILLAYTLEPMTVHWTLPFIIALLWVSVLVSVISFMILFVLIIKGSVTKVASLFYLMPPGTAIMEFLIFGDKLGSIELISLGVITIAIFMVNHSVKAKA